MSRIVVTGGLGFIGSALTRRLAERNEAIVVDADTYAGDRTRIEGLPDIRVEIVDVATEGFVSLIEEIKPATIVHLAAETHVTRGENAASVFERTNVEGTLNAIEAARRTDALLLHVSTDEVYGPIEEGAFVETDKQPGDSAATSAYSKSKSRADDLVVAAMSEVRALVARPSNCYGPWQHPEKAVARWITRALHGESLPVWGDGGQVRDWMFVDDACSALITLIQHGGSGQIFNLAPEYPEWTNLAVAKLVAREVSGDESSVYLTAYDRPDHDRRYRVDASRLRKLGWRPDFDLTEGVAASVDWYRRHLDWVDKHLAGAEKLYADRRPRLV